MKVGMILWSRSELEVDASGGLEMTALNTLKYLNVRGIDTKLFVKGINRKHPHVEVISDLKFLGLYNYIYYLKFILRNLKSDVLLGINCPKLALLCPKKTLVRFGNIPWLPFYTLKVFRYRYNNAHFMFCSKFLKGQFLNEYPDILEDNCFVVYNGVDTSKFISPSENRNESKIKILFVGQWSEEKGIYVLLDAVKLLEKKRSDFELLLGGSPYLWKVETSYPQQQETEKEVNTITQSLKSVKTLGIINHQNLPDIYGSADIFVFPSTWSEPFGNVNLEAMACNLPVIASNVGGVPEVVVDGKTGFW